VTDPEVERLWEQFHAAVNMTSEQLRAWLLTQGSGEEAFTVDPDLDVPQPGRRILAVLRKRKGDLTSTDLTVMREAVERIAELRERPPTDGGADGRWRHALLDLGHDPLSQR
jgi:hypothetical protein